ncbi:MAG TPA: sigma-70 family RNA polymerase sigma factor [Xanthomonadaceae bacterium]|nr:sigma-70 family RNA polymerase sigma factor [Xanthomonadaceae bacterium]
MSLERDELERCYLRLEKPLFNVLYRWLWDDGDCQDVIHDSFMRIWSQRRRVDPARIESLVYATALNLARNRLRWRRLWRWTGLAEDDPDHGESPDRHAEREAESERLRGALESLPTDARDVVLLSEFAGMSTSEIAETLGIAPGTVASRKHRALARLRELLASPSSAATDRGERNG